MSCFAAFILVYFGPFEGHNVLPTVAATSFFFYAYPFHTLARCWMSLDHFGVRYLAQDTPPARTLEESDFPIRRRPALLPESQVVECLCMTSVYVSMHLK